MVIDCLKLYAGRVEDQSVTGLLAIPDLPLHSVEAALNSFAAATKKVLLEVGEVREYASDGVLDWRTAFYQMLEHTADSFGVHWDLYQQLGWGVPGTLVSGSYTLAEVAGFDEYLDNGDMSEMHYIRVLKIEVAEQEKDW
jgi:hypothetical protein